MSITKDDVIAGQQVCSLLTLKIYNLLVIRFSNRFAWRCPSKYLLDICRSCTIKRKSFQIIRTIENRWRQC